MRFYYISIFSVMVLGLIYLLGSGLLAWFGVWLRKRWKKAWTLMVPLFLLFYAAPVAEEFWIAWNFGQLCKKDAGLFVYKTVEVEGFYDDTHTWAERRMNDPAEPRYIFMEGRGQRNGEDVYWRHERVGGAIRSFEIKHPTSRYRFQKDAGTPVSHKVYLQSSSVVEIQSQEILGRYMRYSRQAPWFLIGLNDPGLGCDGPDGGPDTRHSFLIYREVLKPTKSN